MDAHKNFAISLIAVAPIPAASGTTFSVTAGEGAIFPAAPFNVVVWPAGTNPSTTNAEVLRVTSKGTGDNWTATRTQESSSARAIALGDHVANAITVKVLTDIETAQAADAAAITALRPGTSAPTTTGTETALAIPAGTGPLVIFMNNATLLTVQGISAGLDGQTLTIYSKGAGQIDFYHAHASGTALGKLNLFATSGYTSLAAGSGVAVFQYDLTLTKWRLVSHVQGAWITRTFAAGNYTAQAGTWVVAAAARDAYVLRDRSLTFAFAASGTTNNGANTQGRIALPAGFLAAAADTNPLYISNNGAAAVEIGAWLTSAASNVFGTARQASAAIAAATWAVVSTATFEVQ
jgi:hypothetical protein